MLRRAFVTGLGAVLAMPLDIEGARGEGSAKGFALVVAHTPNIG